MLYAKVAIAAPIFPIDTLYDYAVPEELQDSIQEGSLVLLEFRKKKTWGIVWELSPSTNVASKKIKPLIDFKNTQPALSSTRKGFISWLSQRYFYPIGEVVEAALPASIRNGSKKTLEPSEKKSSLKPAKDTPPKLNQEQITACAHILDSKKLKHLLWGVTGSGKTEVYLHLIEEVLKEKKSALVLVPEIALTPLLWSRFEKRFPGEIAVFHSAQKPTEQRRSWLEVLYGKKRIAIGPRSALFAPLENLGIIIVDEEHDGSYKQEERLRYNTRVCVEKLSDIYNAKLVLGSATPSLETLYEVSNNKAQVHFLKQRAVEDATLPSLEIVDLKGELTEKTHAVPILLEEALPDRPNTKETFFISRQLEKAIRESISCGKQSILFLNRRGLGSALVCKTCGAQPECPGCKIKLVPHNKKLMCHYCGFETLWPKECFSCKEENTFSAIGIGTQAVEKAINILFPKARTLRLDRDSVTKVGELENILASFSKGEADILIGTQMVAKGHDFPNVTLVGVLLAEMGLSVPDFRAEERTLQLLLQVSGRAGRAKDRGQVFIQTFVPTHPIFSFMKTQKTLDDLNSFCMQQLQTRELLNYPPHASIVMLRFDGLEEKRVAEAADSVGQALQRASTQGFDVLGPSPSPMSLIRNRYRYQILLKTKNEELLTKALHWVFDTWHTQKLERKFKTRLIVDVDPVQML